MNVSLTRLKSQLEMDNVKPFDEEAALEEQNLPWFAFYLYVDYFEEQIIHPLLARMAQEFDANNFKSMASTAKHLTKACQYGGVKRL